MNYFKNTFCLFIFKCIQNMGEPHCLYCLPERLRRMHAEPGTVCGDLFNDAEGKEPVSAEDLVIKASHLRGDANGDGVVDTVDVTMIQRFLAEFAVPDTFDQIAADADLDGEVDIVDVTLIQRVILNICNWDKVPANAE